MSIQTTALKYGWRIIAGAVLTGSTIFVADSTLKRIVHRDAIKVILGVVERCYATQTTTNPTYSVDPPSFVRSWVSTNGLTGTNFAWVANQVTNTISWYTDRAMMVDLDAKIIALCPYYVDTNSVYDGTTNIVMLTFTGLLTSLNLGDHTNFTSIPAIGTNAATYGPWAWRNYVVAWQERYKVLNALKMTKINSPTIERIGVGSFRFELPWTPFGDIYSETVNQFVSPSSGPPGYETWYNYWVMTNYSDFYSPITLSFTTMKMGESYTKEYSYGVLESDSIIITFPFANTNVSNIRGACLRAKLPQCYRRFQLAPTEARFDDNGYGLQTNTYKYFSVTTNGFLLFDPHTAYAESGSDPGYAEDYTGYLATGFEVSDFVYLADWQFNYATNKYW